jgi:hypothetical protein
MAQTFGTTGDAIVSAIQNASNFTIDSMTAMQAANRAMLLDVAKAPDEFERLTKVAVRLGRVMGLDATQSINDFVTAAGRQSIMIADNLGLTIKVGEANEAYAEKLGRTADSLTKAEQKQAFLTAMLEAGEAKLATMGESSLDAATQIEQLEAAVADTKTELAGMVTEMISAGDEATNLAARIRSLPTTIQELSALAEASIVAVESLFVRGQTAAQGFNTSMLETTGILMDQAQAAQAWADSWEWHRLEAGRGTLDESGQAMDALKLKTMEASVAVGAWEQGMSAALIPTVQTRSAWEGLGFAMEKAIAIGPGVSEAFDAANVKMNEQSIAAGEASLGLEGLLGAAALASEQLGIMAIEEEEAALEAQKLAEEAEILAAAAGDTFVAAAGDAIAETDIWSMALFEAADAAGADAQELALLAAGLGIYTDEQIEAALATVALSTTIDQLGAAIANGTLTTAEAIYELRKQIDLMQFSIGVTDRNTSSRRVNTDVTRRNTEERRRNAEKAREQARAERELQRALARTGDHFVDFILQAEMATEETDAWAVALFEAADAAGADAQELALLAGALGLYTQEQVEAALAAAAMQEQIEALGKEIAAGMGMDEAMAKFDEFRASLSLPEWLTPGSMTPLEVGIRGVASAMRELATVEMPALQSGMIAGSDRITNNQFNMTVNTRATTPTVQQDFATMRALVG